MTIMMHYGKAPCGCLVGIVRDQVGDLPHKTHDAYLKELHELESQTIASGGSMHHAPSDDVVRLPVKCEAHKARREAE